MVRRTKEQALVTRHTLLDAAELLFQARGVSGTSLQAIAQAAGTTRGAVYWHFRDKADLFNTMAERVTLPMERVFSGEMTDTPNCRIASLDHATQLKAATTVLLSQIVLNAQTRRVLEVATQKVEYVEENNAIRERYLLVRRSFTDRCESRLVLAAQQAGLALPVSTGMAARGFRALIDGLNQSWLLGPLAFDLVKSGALAMDVYLAGLGLTPQSGVKPQSAELC